MKDYNAIDILNAREARVYLIEELIEKYSLPIICLRINYPGEIKNNDLTSNISKVLREEVLNIFRDDILYENFKFTAEGPLLILVINDDAFMVKKKTIELEENHLLGRLGDIDVYDEKGNGISRKDLGYSSRKCFICSDMAQNCVRAQKHSIEEVIKFIEERYIKYLNKEAEKTHE
ncbi:citrate lyase holo-[acyl-carrier protein] synthase [Clostridium peptidivorans]|uniref:citrate lyase holo-[acyl-carrier protein] synthase n=1 Tax=Clostridium peptidivorans TaxID=100174 RepID=UPI000BE34F8E|nr:citrate lyase holo-[acyl-carrier protein] synthase [Clostridium peptidivorans]